MLQTFYKNIGSFILKRKAKKEAGEEHSFKNFIENSLKFLIIMPLDESMFNKADSFLKYLTSRNKSLYLLLPEHKLNMIQNQKSYKFVHFKEDDIGKLYLPHKSFTNKLENKEFDVVVDLNLSVNLFSYSVAYFSKSKFRVGFTKRNSDYYYNFQIPPVDDDADNSYGNLVNCLKMF